MSDLVANCPSCGAPVRFLWSGAIQTTCGYCNSILVRHDVDLEAVGKKSLPPTTASPIQIGTRGRYRDRAFTVVGRIAYEYERGAWNEWHLVFGDDTSGWLSDAQAEYAVSFLTPPPAPLPAAQAVQPGARFVFGDTEYQASTLTRARYRGVEGELPFEYWDKDEVPFVDLESVEGRFGTIDYSEPEPLLFLGEYVDFDALKLTELRDPEARRVAGVRTLNCPNCGGGVTIRDPEHSLNVVCGSCHSVLDARVPGLKVLQTFHAKQKVRPLIPLGARGIWKGKEYQVLGLQERGIQVEGVWYRWREYILFNQEQGYRYFTEYDGHWNDVVPLRSVPEEGREGGKPVAKLNGETFRHFQTATAETSYVMGEFPWEVRVGDKVVAADFVAPPRMLSSEVTDEERTWSLGEYVPGERIWEAFELEGSPPAARGVFANQPSPYRERTRARWRAFRVLMVILLGLFVWRVVLHSPQRVLSGQARYDPASPESSVVLTDPFTLKGHPSNLDVTLDTDLSNNWAYFNFALINQETGKVTEFGREVSYYWGTDEGENWSEGDKYDDVVIPTVPAGRYVLRIAPEGPAPVTYTVRIERDVPSLLFFFLAFLLLLVPPVLLSLRSWSFEKARWAESDYAPESSDDDD